MSHFPALRLRRTRSTAWSRALVAETHLAPQHLIWPLFVTSGTGTEEPIGSLPGVSRWSVDLLAAQVKVARDLGIGCVALFPNTPRELRTDGGEEALNPDNLMCRAIREIKAAVPDIGVLTDVALDPYTAHGHDGLVDGSGYVLNDATSDVLVGQALNQAAAGADIIAPSDMMDGRVGAIREALEGAGHHNVQIWPMPPNMRRRSMVRSAMRWAPVGCLRVTRKPTRWILPMPRKRCAKWHSTLTRGPTA
jgi:porphobilinogen synthase